MARERGKCGSDGSAAATGGLREEELEAVAEPATATGQPHRDPHPITKPLAAKRMDAKTAAPVLGPRWIWTPR